MNRQLQYVRTAKASYQVYTSTRTVRVYCFSFCALTTWPCSFDKNVLTRTRTWYLTHQCIIPVSLNQRFPRRSGSGLGFGYSSQQQYRVPGTALRTFNHFVEAGARSIQPSAIKPSRRCYHELYLPSLDHNKAATKNPGGPLVHGAESLAHFANLIFKQLPVRKRGCSISRD